MGDPRRFLTFADLIARNSSGREQRIVDIAGGYGSLRAALCRYGFHSVTTFDPRQYKGREKPRCARVRRCDPGQSHYLKLFDYRKERGFNLVVAMHPDGGTDHAVMYAREHQCPAFICPCCVVPSAAPYSQGRSKTLWRRHLQQLAGNMIAQWVDLPIAGDAAVLILRPRDRRTAL